MPAADVGKMDAQSVFALITGAVRAEHLCGGILKTFFENGAMLKFLQQLRDIDSQGAYGKMAFNNMSNKML